MGNLAIEMSAQDEKFRVQIEEFFKQWVDSVAEILKEMIKNQQLDDIMDPIKSATSMIAMIEGGILLMVSQQNIQVLQNVFDVIRHQYHLN